MYMSKPTTVTLDEFAICRAQTALRALLQMEVDKVNSLDLDDPQRIYALECVESTREALANYNYVLDGEVSYS